MILPSFFCVGILSFTAPPTIDPHFFGEKDPTSLVPTEFYQGNKATMNYRDFSSALTRGELANRIARLPISDEVREALIACAAEKYPEYLAAHHEVATRLAQPYFDISCKLIEQRKLTGKQPTVEKLREQIQASQEIQRNLITTELDFLLAVQDCFSLEFAFANSGITASQSNSNFAILESLRLHAEYRYSEHDNSIIQRGINLDLRDFVNTLELHLHLRQELETVLLEYERSMASLKPLHYKAFWEVAPRMQALIERSDAGSIDADNFRAQAKKVSEAAPEIGARIRNEALYAASKISSKLPADKKALFERAIHNAIFPELIEDKLGESLRTEFTSALARTDLPKDIVQRVENLRQTWIAELTVCRTTAEAKLLEWSDGRASGNQSYGQANFKPMLAELLKKRDDLHETWRVLLADQLPVVDKKSTADQR